MSIPESDWKRLRSLKPIALERLSTSALAECADLLASPASSAHERFLALFQRVHEKNDDLAEAFDDHRRSTAVHRLAAMLSLGLLTDEEFAEFTEETQQQVRSLAQLRRERYSPIGPPHARSG
jgi:hypothetical protein